MTRIPKLNFLILLFALLATNEEIGAQEESRCFLQNLSSLTMASCQERAEQICQHFAPEEKKEKDKSIKYSAASLIEKEVNLKATNPAQIRECLTQVRASDFKVYSAISQFPETAQAQYPAQWEQLKLLTNSDPSLKAYLQQSLKMNFEISSTHFQFIESSLSRVTKDNQQVVSTKQFYVDPILQEIAKNPQGTTALQWKTYFQITGDENAGKFPPESLMAGKRASLSDLLLAHFLEKETDYFGHLKISTSQEIEKIKEAHQYYQKTTNPFVIFNAIAQGEVVRPPSSYQENTLSANSCLSDFFIMQRKEVEQSEAHQNLERIYRESLNEFKSLIASDWSFGKELRKSFPFLERMQIPVMSKKSKETILKGLDALEFQIGQDWRKIDIFSQYKDLYYQNGGYLPQSHKVKMLLGASSLGGAAENELFTKTIFFHELGHMVDFLVKGEVKEGEPIGEISEHSKESLAQFKNLCQYNYLPSSDAKAKSNDQQTEDFGDFIAAKALSHLSDQFYTPEQLQVLFKDFCQSDADERGHGSAEERILHLLQHNQKLREAIHCQVEKVCPVN